MEYAFAAMMARMSYISRWGLMRNSRAETLSEHALNTAITAHLLACLARSEFGQADVNADRVARAALYHDASEILTGDLPTPVKYANDSMRREYKQLERQSAEQLCAMVPASVEKDVFTALTGDDLSPREAAIVKAADKICALVKCIEEERNGNTEFQSTKRSTLEILNDDPLPETSYYLEHFLPAFSQTLDELLGR